MKQKADNMRQGKLTQF